MKAVSKILTSAAAVAAISLGAAAPAAALYYPGYGGYGGGGLGDVITGAVLNSILRGGNPYGYNQYYGRNDYDLERAAVQQCAAATEQRLNGRYGGYNGYGGGYAGYNQPYGGYNQPYGGYNQPYTNGYNQANFRFDCKFERNGRISDLKVSRA